MRGWRARAAGLKNILCPAGSSVCARWERQRAGATGPGAAVHRQGQGPVVHWPRRRGRSPGCSTLLTATNHQHTLSPSNLTTTTKGTRTWRPVGATPASRGQGRVRRTWRGCVACSPPLGSSAAAPVAEPVHRLLGTLLPLPLAYPPHALHTPPSSTRHAGWPGQLPAHPAASSPWAGSA